MIVKFYYSIKPTTFINIPKIKVLTNTKRQYTRTIREIKYMR